MFDIGFSELILIGVVALIVIGPERLPKVARTAGHLFGRFQRYVNSVKSDISREMELDELRKAGQAFKESVESGARGLESKASETEYSMRDEIVVADKAITAVGMHGEQDPQVGNETQATDAGSGALKAGPSSLDGDHPALAPTPSAELPTPESRHQDKV